MDERRHGEDGLGGGSGDQCLRPLLSGLVAVAGPSVLCVCTSFFAKKNAAASDVRTGGGELRQRREGSGGREKQRKRSEGDEVGWVEWNGMLHATHHGFDNK